LGFILAALGAGAFVAGVFHVMTPLSSKGFFFGSGFGYSRDARRTKHKENGHLAKYMLLHTKHFCLDRLQ
jgi:NADH:ubiquinone oxidoreductase subunit 5 (subunit L)/multisubunit Na+/H+ antiporter MnhA subunit